MVTIMWSDESRMTADSWEHLLERIAAVQWHTYTPEQMRHVLAKRAWRWNRVEVDPDAPAAEFFRQLEKAKLILIEKDDEGVTT